MEDLINGRAPEEIKTIIGVCALGQCAAECPHHLNCECTEDLLADAYNLIVQLEEQIPKWISVKERLPTEGDVVFGWLEINAGLILLYRDGAFLDLAFEEPTMLVTHWMPLPEPPKEE